MTSEVEDLYLQPWQEIVGICIAMLAYKDGTTLVMQAGNKKYRLHLSQVRIKPEILNQQRIGVLRTQRPFLVRTIGVAHEKH